jgi:hypothetical protein
MEKQLLNWLTVVIIATMVFTALEFVPIGNIVKATTTNSQVSANVNVQSTLYTSITPKSFTWNGYPNTYNATNTLITVDDINGNIPGNIFISGSADLTYGSNDIAIGNILWNPTLVNTYTGNSVTTIPTNTLIVVPAPSLTQTSTSNSIYLGANIPAGAPSGLYTGNVYFELENGSTTSSQATLAVAVNVLSVCYISLNTLAINFGTIASGTNTIDTSNGIQDTDNGGNAPATIYVAGTNWFLTTNSAISFGVSNTVWSPSSTTPYTSGNALTSSETTTGIVIAAPTSSTPSTSNTVYFGVAVPGGAPVGAYTQNIVIENSC